MVVGRSPSLGSAEIARSRHRVSDTGGRYCLRSYSLQTCAVICLQRDKPSGDRPCELRSAINERDENFVAPEAGAHTEAVAASVVPYQAAASRGRKPLLDPTGVAARRWRRTGPVGRMVARGRCIEAHLESFSTCIARSVAAINATNACAFLRRNDFLGTN